jgi:hypothetical protein
MYSSWPRIRHQAPTAEQQFAGRAPTLVFAAEPYRARVRAKLASQPCAVTGRAGGPRLAH